MKPFSNALAIIAIALIFSSAITTDSKNISGGRFLQELTPPPIEKLCPSINYFRPTNAKNKGGLEKVEENSNGDFCPKVKQTCCSDTDWGHIKNWWQEDKSWSRKNVTRAHQRKQKL